MQLLHNPLVMQCTKKIYLYEIRMMMSHDRSHDVIFKMHLGPKDTLYDYSV